MTLPLRLRVHCGQEEPFEKTFDSDSVIIGRASSVDLSLPDRFLSRQHTRIFRDGDRFYVEDLGSRNGTILNGSTVHRPTVMKAGDEIRLSGNRIILLGEKPIPVSSTPVAFSPDSGLRTIFREVSTLGAHKETEASSEAELRHYVERLQILNEVHQALARSAGLDELLELILDRIFDHLRPEHGAIYLRQPDGGMKTAARRYLAGGEVEQTLSQSLVREVADKGKSALVLDARTDERFASAQSILTSGVRSLLAAPLLGPSGSLGMIVLGSRAHVRQFTEEDLELLGSLASVAALRIHNVALTEEAAERRRLEKELALARRIQEGLLPKTLPDLAGYELHAGNVPSRGVSGDFYNLVSRAEDSSCVVILADVSGKGMAASLLTASLEALTAGPIEVGRKPTDICDRVSRRLYSRTPPEKYATAILGRLVPSSGDFEYCNAGHNPGILVRADGSIEHLSSTGVPIGLLASFTYQGNTVTLLPGDLLVLYTDGITEAEDPDDEEFGQQRLEEVCREHRTLSLAEIAQLVDRELLAFTRGTPFADDRTLVLLRRSPA